MVGNHVVGIASYVVLKCGSGLPDVFTRVSSFSGWILEQIDDKKQHKIEATTESLIDKIRNNRKL